MRYKQSERAARKENALLLCTGCEGRDGRPLVRAASPATSARHDGLRNVLLVVVVRMGVAHRGAHPTVDALGVVREEVAQLLQLGREAHGERVKRRVLRGVVPDS